jgi:transcriptional repressor of cell division inhibition gene dicB
LTAVNSNVDFCQRKDYCQHMLKEDAIRFYGSAANLAKALDVNRSVVTRWPKRLPIFRAHQLERLSKGKLRVSLNAYLGTK